MIISGEPLWFAFLVLFISLVSGATASIVGFGIGSLLTPLFTMRFDAQTAIAAVALPHLAGGFLRGWSLRRGINWQILVRFGSLSAIGGLTGAFLFSRLTHLALTRILGALLVLTAIAGLTDSLKHWKPKGALVWILGALSGFFGGVVGNQGGLRAAALSSFGLSPADFVATSTVIGIFIDAARIPVYLYGSGSRLEGIWVLIFTAIVGVLAGTLIGRRLLFGLSPSRFRLLVSIAVGLLGIKFLIAGK